MNIYKHSHVDIAMSPFKSQAQRKYLFVHNPELAEEFAKKTMDIRGLPDYVRNKRRRR